MTGFRIAVLILGALIFAQFNEWPVLDQLSLALAALVALAYIWTQSSLRGLAVGRRVDADRRQVGQTLQEEIVVENRSRFGKLWLEVRDLSTLPGHAASRAIQVAGRSGHSWMVATVCAKRGRYRTGPVVIRGGDPFGLFSRARHFPAQIEVLVYPAVVPLPGFVLPAGMLSGGQILDQRTPFVTPSVSTIRDYVPGDAFSRISWSATARLGRLMVKEFDIDPTSDIWLILDLDRQYRYVTNAPAPLAPDPSGAWPVEAWLNATDEYAIAIVASLARRCLDQGRAVGLIASGAHHEVMPAERSDRQFVKMLETLAVVEADGDRPLAEVLVAEARRFTRDSGVIVVTASTDETWVAALAALAERRVRSRAVVIDPSSFAPGPSVDHVVQRLLFERIPVHWVRFGDSIAASLTTASGVAAAAGGVPWGR
ncbi:MAG: hypothetical protein KatS3mg059_1205 [Thermomicrobiales bacterium]|nr:MAG: hypothetical protein KatS3mg059_1205 [Thermomicrobiales bacterium]